MPKSTLEILNDLVAEGRLYECSTDLGGRAWAINFAYTELLKEKEKDEDDVRG